MQRTDFLSPTENQAFKAAVSTFVILSQVSADLFILPQASAAGLKQENLHFHFKADVALRADGKSHRCEGSAGSTEKWGWAPWGARAPDLLSSISVLPTFKTTRPALTSAAIFFVIMDSHKPSAWDFTGLPSNAESESLALAIRELWPQAIWFNTVYFFATDYSFSPYPPVC